MKQPAPKHGAQLPNVRHIKRTCKNELYRTYKRLNSYIPPEKQEKALSLYSKKVLLNLPWIYERQSNRAIQADWWDENVCEELAELLDLPPAKLSEAFRDAYGAPKTAYTSPVLHKPSQPSQSDANVEVEQ